MLHDNSLFQECHLHKTYWNKIKSTINIFMSCTLLRSINRILTLYDGTGDSCLGVTVNNVTWTLVPHKLECSQPYNEITLSCLVQFIYLNTSGCVLYNSSDCCMESQ